MTSATNDPNDDPTTGSADEGDEAHTETDPVGTDETDETGETDEADETDDAADSDWLEEHRLRLAQERASAIAAGRRKAGVAGAAMAGAMLALRDVIEGPPKDAATIEVEASSDPVDLDSDGFEMTVGDVDVEAPPLQRLAPDHHQQGSNKDAAQRSNSAPRH